MTYIQEESKVIYQSKDGKKEEAFDALEWLVPTESGCSHVPNKGEQKVRYYGYYSPAPRGISRGRKKNKNQDEWMLRILEANESSREYRKNWAQLIQKIYEVDPLTCPKCSGKMKVISVIEDEDVIKKILKHLGLWELKARPPPRANALPKAPKYSTTRIPSSL